jgi:hypothetical protein
MSTEEEIAEKLAEYQEMAKSDPSIDVASLMMSAFDTVDKNLLTAKEKRIAYFVSLLVPPFGLIFVVKFYLSEKSDGKSTAIICAVLTLISLVAGMVFIKAFTSTAGVNLQQIEQIKPGDIQQLIQY